MNVTINVCSLFERTLIEQNETNVIIPVLAIEYASTKAIYSDNDNRRVQKITNANPINEY